MRYKVDYVCSDIEYGYEGEEIEVERKHTRYFDGYYAYAQFEQDLDMAGEGRVVNESHISDFRSNFYYMLATIIYLLGGGYYMGTRKLFYKLMSKTLRPLANDELCRLFDDCMR